MISSAFSRIAGILAGVMVLAVGCGDSNSDRAGGARTAEPVVLTMAQGNDGAPEQLVAWADEVALVKISTSTPRRAMCSAVCRT